MTHNKPIIGIAGGIGAGKSYVAQMFGELGCAVLSADDAVSQAYKQEPVREQLRSWWGEEAFDSDGQINRKWIAQKVFNDPTALRRLEQLIHPQVQQIRQEQMNRFADDAKVLAFVWDIPLLFETGQDRQCDYVVYVDAPEEQRLARLQRSRGWDRSELIRRENLQMPLDKKQEMSDYRVVNAAEAAETRRQVRDVLSRILQSSSCK